MSDRVRVFIVAATPGEVASLRARAARAGYEVVGAASLGDLEQGLVRVAPDADAVLATPGTWGRARQPRAIENAGGLVEQLTTRERDVLALASDGLSNREIAAELAISEHTVKFHLASVYGKLGVSSRTEAVRRGLQLGLLDI